MPHLNLLVIRSEEPARTAGFCDLLLWKQAWLPNDLDRIELEAITCEK